MLFTISLDFGVREKLCKLSAEDYAPLPGLLPGAKLPEAQANLNSWYAYDNKFLADKDALDKLLSVGIAPRLHKTRGMVHGNALPESVATREDVQRATTQIVNISVAGPSLFAVDEVAVEEDCCTVALQHWLNDGWRIICVCPPNDSRRPTYILGRQKPSK